MFPIFINDIRQSVNLEPSESYYLSVREVLQSARPGGRHFSQTTFAFVPSAPVFEVIDPVANVNL